MQEEGKITVVDYWKPVSDATTWKKWLSKEQWQTQVCPMNVDHLLQDLDKRRILKSNKEDILRWGRNPKGTFNLKEAYQILATTPDPKLDHKWQSLWNRGKWPKITLLSSLIVDNKALTWENL